MINEEGPTIPYERATKERLVYSFRQLSDVGVLWLINRVVFHPRGLALALDFAKGEKEPGGWSLHGYHEPVAYDLPPDYENDKYEIVEHLILEAKRLGRMPVNSSEDQT